MSQCYVRNLNVGVGLIDAFLFKVKSFFFFISALIWILDIHVSCYRLFWNFWIGFILNHSFTWNIVNVGTLYLSYCTSTYIIAVRYIVCDFYRCDFHSTRLVCRKLSVLSITYSQNTQNIIMILLFIFPDHMDFVSSSLF